MTLRRTQPVERRETCRSSLEQTQDNTQVAITKLSFAKIRFRFTPLTVSRVQFDSDPSSARELRQANKLHHSRLRRRRRRKHLHRCAHVDPGRRGGVGREAVEVCAASERADRHRVFICNEKQSHFSANSTPLVPRTAITNLAAVAKISTIKQFHTMPSDSFTMLERWVTKTMQNTSFIAHIIGFLGNLPSERFHRQEQRSSVQRLVSSNVPVSPPASQRPLP